MTGESMASQTICACVALGSSQPTPIVKKELEIRSLRTLLWKGGVYFTPDPVQDQATPNLQVELPEEQVFG